MGPWSNGIRLLCEEASVSLALSFNNVNVRTEQEGDHWQDRNRAFIRTLPCGTLISAASRNVRKQISVVQTT